MRARTWLFAGWTGIVLLGGCGRQAPHAPPGATASEPAGHDLPVLEGAGDLAAIRARGELVVATRNAPTISYIDREGRGAGPEHDLAVAFARSLGVKARFIDAKSVEGILQAVANGAADMAAGAITRTAQREQRYTFGPDYARVSQEVVCRSPVKPRKVSDLAQVDKLAVVADSSYAARLAWLAHIHPRDKLRWREVDDASTEQLLGRVADGRLGCTVADSNIVAMNRRYHPELLVMFRISPLQHLAWPMPKGSRDLQQAARHWLASWRESGKFAHLIQHYYGFIHRWDYVDKKTLLQRLSRVYPRFDAWFAQAGEKYDFDKWLLAAQAYQESHWNPAASSHMGARGIMMLTPRTARSLGVEDLHDARQSIMAGAAYLRKMEDKLPADILPPDRYYFALVAYNLGYFHLRDAMRLARRLGLDPHRWADLRKTLPLLMQKKYYRNARYGYARGSESVRYVRRIRDYADIIRRVAPRLSDSRSRRAVRIAPAHEPARLPDGAPTAELATSTPFASHDPMSSCKYSCRTPKRGSKANGSHPAAKRHIDASRWIARARGQ